MDYEISSLVFVLKELTVKQLNIQIRRNIIINLISHSYIF